jgi:hypothetical protein
MHDLQYKKNSNKTIESNKGGYFLKMVFEKNKRFTFIM